MHCTATAGKAFFLQRVTVSGETAAATLNFADLSSLQTNFAVTMKTSSTTEKLRNATKQAEVEITLRKSVLTGAFTSIARAEWRTPPFKLIPFISSTFTDTEYERDFLQELLLEMRTVSRKDGLYHSMSFGWTLF